MPKNFFDVLCLGTELPGVIAASVLAKAGYRTMLVPLDSGHRGPAPPLLMTGVRSSPVMKWTFSHLGLTQEIRNRLVALDPSYQVASPGQRVSIGGTSPDTDAELMRAFPDHYDELDGMVSLARDGLEAWSKLFDETLALPPLGFWQRRALANRLKGLGLDPEVPDPFSGLPDDHPARALFEVPVSFLAPLTGEGTGLGKVRTLGHLLHGISMVPGNRKGLLGLLLERFATYGGVVGQGLGLPGELLVPWAKPLLLVFDGGHEEIGCELVIHNHALEALVPALAPSGKRKALEAMIRDARPEAYHVTLSISMPEDGLPEAMGRVLFLVPGQGEQRIMIVTQTADGAARVSITVRVPARVVEDSGAYLVSALWPEVRASLERLMPFLDEQPVEVHDTAAVEPVWSTGGTGLGAIGALGYETPYRRILLGGSGLLPGLGMEGQFIAGLSLARAVGRVLRRQNLLP